MEESVKHIEDELLVLRCQDREVAALSELVHRWHGRLSRFVFRLTEHKEATEDVTQECWLAVASGIRKLDDPARFRGWLFRIAANKAADWIRREQRKRKTQEGLLSESDTQIAPESCESESDITILRKALRRLPKEQRVILRLKYLEGIRTDDIAEILKVPAGTVKSRLYYAREALREQIAKTKQH